MISVWHCIHCLFFFFFQFMHSTCGFYPNGKRRRTKQQNSPLISFCMNPAFQIKERTIIIHIHIQNAIKKMCNTKICTTVIFKQHRFKINCDVVVFIVLHIFGMCFTSSLSSKDKNTKGRSVFPFKAATVGSVDCCCTICGASSICEFYINTSVPSADPVNIYTVFSEVSILVFLN